MRRLLKKQASMYMLLHSFVTKNGYPIEFIARVSSNRLYYSIIMLNQFSSSSFYDGESFEAAFDFYIEIMTALYSLIEAEKVSKKKQTFLDKAIHLLDETAVNKYRHWHTPYHKAPLFLGMNDF